MTRELFQGFCAKLFLNSYLAEYAEYRIYGPPVKGVSVEGSFFKIPTVRDHPLKTIMLFSTIFGPIKVSPKSRTP